MQRIIHRAGNSRHLIAPLASIGLLWLLWDRTERVDIAQVVQFISQFSPAQWGFALLFTLISFRAIAGYDLLIARYLELELPKSACLSAGWRATAIAQTLGFGLITGALVRARLLSGPAGINLWQATRMTAAVTAMFLFCWGVLAGGAMLARSELTLPFKALGACAILLGILIALLAIYPPTSITRLIPPFRCFAKAFLLAAIDTSAAAMVIYSFLPIDYASFHIIFSAFLIALAAGMISGLPGGVGAFEICMITLVPHTDSAQMLAAIFGFRAVYYALPACLAVHALIRPATIHPNTTKLPRRSGTLTSNLKSLAPPEAQLLQLRMLQAQTSMTGQSATLFHRATNSDLILGDPFGPEAEDPEFITQLSLQANHSSRGLCLYKGSIKTARIAKNLGWIVHKIGAEAILNPKDFDLNTPSRRQLRRKLRKAEKAGLSIENTLPYSVATAIDAQWQARNGGAKRFSMGVLAPDLFARQIVFAAHSENGPQAFVTFNRSANIWSLDLIRSNDNCPDGTIYMLIAHAIAAAKRENIHCLSLAAAPFSHLNGGGWGHKLGRHVFSKDTNLQGLLRFKQTFAPTWRPLFIAAPGTLDLVLGAIDLWRVIQPEKARGIKSKDEIHDDYGYYEFASQTKLWHPRT